MSDRDRELLENIAANVRRLREAAGLSMRGLAEKSGDFGSAVLNVERAQHMPGAGLLYRLATALGVTPNDLFKEVTSPARKKLARAC